MAFGFPEVDICTPRGKYICIGKSQTTLVPGLVHNNVTTEMRRESRNVRLYAVSCHPRSPIIGEGGLRARLTEVKEYKLVLYVLQKINTCN